MIQIVKQIGEIEATFAVNPDGEPAERQPSLTFNDVVQEIAGLENLLDLHKALTVFLQNIQTLELTPKKGPEVRRARA